MFKSILTGERDMFETHVEDLTSQANHPYRKLLRISEFQEIMRTSKSAFL